MLYCVRRNLIDLNVPKDLWEVVGPTDRIIRIHKIYVYQTGYSGDANAEHLHLKMILGGTASTGGAAQIERALEKGDPINGGVEFYADRSADGTGGNVVISQGWPIMSTWRYDSDYAPWQAKVYVSPNQRFQLRCSASAKSGPNLTADTCCIFEVIGG